MRFLVHPTVKPAEWPEVYRAYLCGYDQAVHPTRVEYQDDILVCRRQTSESGKMQLAWEVAGFGRPVLSTASLPEREEPYLLTVELARGRIVQVRNQVASWESSGMLVPEEFRAAHREAHRLFARASGRLDDAAAASQLAQSALEKACLAAEILTQAYTTQSLTNRFKKFLQVPSVLGCSLPEDVSNSPAQDQFLNTFTAAAINIDWHSIEPKEGEYHWEKYDAEVEWCLEHRLLIRGGPLLDFSPNGLPPWLQKWEHDVWNLQSFICDFVETAMRRYLGKVRIWEVAARGNSGGALALSEENRLTLVAKTLEVARHIDEESQLMIRVDQPWAEYQARGQHRLSPLHFADALTRAGLGLSGINLEIAVGYQPRSTSSRDLLDYSRLIDAWSSLGLPLHITLAFPSSDAVDPTCRSELEVIGPSWKSPWSHEAQAEWAAMYVPLLLAKPAVTGVFWTHYSDSDPHTFPHAGLVDGEGIAKPALETIAKLRHDYLR